MGSDVKQKMKDAVMELLKKKNYLQITVTDLVNQAGVARASFYRIYNSIDEVVDDVLIDVKNGVATNLIPVLLSGSENAIKEVISDSLEKIKNHTVPFLELLPENTEFMTNKYEQASLIKKESEFKSIEDKFTPYLNITIILTVARTWAYYGYKETTAEVTDYIYDYIYNGKYRNTF